MMLLINRKKTILSLLLILIIGQQGLKSQAQELNKNINISKPEKFTKPQAKKSGWSKFQPVKNFPNNQNNNLIVQENLINQIEPKSKLIGEIWQLQEIYDDQNELINIDNQTNYTIQFLPNEVINIKADCNQAKGTYTQADNSLSIIVNLTTMAICPPESYSEEFLRQIQLAKSFSIQENKLHIDLENSQGKLIFITSQENSQSPENQQKNFESLSNYQNASGLGGPSSVNNELKEDTQQQKKESLLPGIDAVFQPWFEFKENLAEDIGLTFGIDYNFLYQKLSDSPGFDEASGGIFRFFGNWTLLGRNTNAPGSFVFKVENRHRFGKIAPQNLGFQTGYLGLTGTQFSDFGWGVTNLYWQQKFNDGKISFVIGTVDPTDYVDIYGLTNPLTHFQNLAFLTDPSIAVPNQGLGMAVGAMLSDNFYLITGFSDANGDPTKAGFDTFFDDAEYFKHIELGWTSSFERRYFDNIHITAWHVDEREKAQVPDSWGIAFSASWFINDRWMPFLRMGYSDGEAALNERNISIGFGRYFNRNGNLLGLGLSLGKPVTEGLDDQVTTEVFYRIQMTQNWAITPDIQVIFDPALNLEEDVIAVFGIRSRLNF